MKEVESPPPGAYVLPKGKLRKAQKETRRARPLPPSASRSRRHRLCRCRRRRRRRLQPPTRQQRRASTPAGERLGRRAGSTTLLPRQCPPAAKAQPPPPRVVETRCCGLRGGRRGSHGRPARRASGGEGRGAAVGRHHPPGSGEGRRTAAPAAPHPHPPPPRAPSRSILPGRQAPPSPPLPVLSAATAASHLRTRAALPPLATLRDRGGGGAHPTATPIARASSSRHPTRPTPPQPASPSPPPPPLAQLLSPWHRAMQRRTPSPTPPPFPGVAPVQPNRVAPPMGRGVHQGRSVGEGGWERGRDARRWGGGAARGHGPAAFSPHALTPHASSTHPAVAGPPRGYEGVCAGA